MHDLHRALIADGEFAVGVGILPSVLCGTAQAEIRIFLVQPIVFVQNADALGFDGGDRTEQIPHDLEMIVHLPAAPHDITHAGIFISIAGTAGDGVLFKDVDAFARHLGIPHQITGGGQGRQTGADDVSALVFHALGLFGTGKGFVITAGIIHDGSSFFVDWFRRRFYHSGQNLKMLFADRVI